MAINKPSISLDMADEYIPNQVSAVIGTDECEARSKFWIAVYTRPRSERKAVSELNKLGIETYLPVQKQLRKWSDRKKLIDFPVIPMILFANITDDDLPAIKIHPLILKYISNSEKKGPAHIPNNQIEKLKFMLGQSEVPVSFEQDHFKSDDIVEVVRGSLKGLIEQVKAVKDNLTEVWISIDMLGGAVMKINSTELERHRSTTHQ